MRRGGGKREGEVIEDNMMRDKNFVSGKVKITLVTMIGAVVKEDIGYGEWG